MPGKRQPTAVVKANGRKNMTKTEEAERLAGEVHVDPPKQIQPPSFLPKRLHKEFLEVAGILAGLELYSDLDRDVLGQYFVCRERWIKADRHASRAINNGNSELAKEWNTVQSSYFKQARQCAEAMGLSVTSRCRLVVPNAPPKPEDNPFGQLIVLPGAVNG